MMDGAKTDRASLLGNTLPRAYGRKLDKYTIVGHELAVASCHTPVVLDLVEEPLDQVARPLAIWAEA
jgi:hypothetical protein